MSRLANGEPRILASIGNLSSFLTLIAILAIGFGAAQKLDAIATHGRENCQAFAAATILSLETARASAPRHSLRSLDRAVLRFERLARHC